MSSFRVNTCYGPTRHIRLVVVHIDTVFQHSRLSRQVQKGRQNAFCLSLSWREQTRYFSAPVSLVRYRLNDPRSVSLLGQDIFFFSQKRPHRLWGPPSLVFGSNWGTFPRVKWLGACSSTTHLHILPRFKNEYRYTSTTSLLPHDVDKGAFTFLVLHFYYVRGPG